MRQQHIAKQVLAAAFIVMLTTTFASQTALAAPTGGSILMVGNSFSRGIKRPLRKIFQAAGTRVRIATYAPNAWTLSKHAASNRTRRKIESRAWDLVVLQEQSARAGYRTYAAAHTLYESIVATGAATGFMMSWRDRGVPAVSYDSLAGEVGGSYGYVPIAAEPLPPRARRVRRPFLAGTLEHSLIQPTARDHKTLRIVPTPSSDTRPENPWVDSRVSSMRVTANGTLCTC